MPLIKDKLRVRYIISEVSSSQSQAINLPRSGILPKRSKNGERYRRRVNKGIKTKFAIGDIKDIKSKFKNTMGKVIRLITVVVIRLPIKKSSTLNLSSILSLFSFLILPILATITELRAQPSMAKKERRRLTENTEYGDIMQITVTDTNIPVMKSDLCLKKNII